MFLYGKQYWFALAALGHLVRGTVWPLRGSHLGIAQASAIMVFAEAVRNIGVVPYNVVIFLSVWCVRGPSSEYRTR